MRPVRKKSYEEQAAARAQQLRRAWHKAVFMGWWVRNLSVGEPQDLKQWMAFCEACFLAGLDVGVTEGKRQVPQEPPKVEADRHAGGDRSVQDA
jgi:hypothetical protein